MIDPTKLTPMPVTVQGKFVWGPPTAEPGQAARFVPIIGHLTNPADAEFYVAAREAFDVMVRRGWGPQMTADGWTVRDFPRKHVTEGVKTFREWAIRQSWPDPFSALIEADRWYTANVDGATQGGGGTQ